MSGILSLILGLVLFLGVHCVPILSWSRSALVEKLGLMGYRAAFSLVSFLGLYLIVTGYGKAKLEDLPLLYSPPDWTAHLTMLLMVPVFILLISAYVQGQVKRVLRHPMLVAVKLWALSHLLVRGDLASVLLFGGFLVWAVLDRISLKRRTLAGPPLALQLEGRRTMAEALVVLAGLIAYGLFVWKGHYLVIGYPLT